jgi:hypothetical protein
MGRDFGNLLFAAPHLFVANCQLGFSPIFVARRLTDSDKNPAIQDFQIGIKRLPLLEEFV